MIIMTDIIDFKDKMDYKKITLDDIEIISPFFNYNKSRICDFTVGGIFMWRDFFNTEYKIEQDSLFMRQYYGGVRYYFLPLSKDVDFAFNLLIKNEKNKEINFCVFPFDYLNLLKNKDYTYDITEEIGFFDYIYNAKDLLTLSGKKYSAQRNLIHQFIRNYPDYEYIDINNKNVYLLKDFLKNGYQVRENATSFEMEEEKKVFEVLDNFDKYNFFGSYLKDKEQIIGFSLGEKMNDTVYVHIEKGNKQVKGAYQMLVNLFAKKYCENVNYINREEDMNDLGLKLSKQSYHPTDLLKKYTVVIKK